jgi:hypothetical protein
MDGTNVALPASPARRHDALVRILLITVLALALAAAGASTARADDGPGDDGDRFDVRVTGHCNGGAWSRLRLVGRDGRIEIRFELRNARRGALWKVVVTHERRIVARATPRASSGSFELRRNVADFAGADAVSVRATGPRGETCWARLSH